MELTSKGEAIQDVKEKKPRKKSKIKDKDSDNVINIKPFLNFTASLLGINTVLPEDQKYLDPSDPATVIKSMFNIWNPKVSFQIFRVVGVTPLYSVCKGGSYVFAF